MSEEPSGGLRTAILLFALTFLSMLYVGCMWLDEDPLIMGWWNVWRGYPFAVPLMAILLAHELGHFFAARIHRVDVSFPYFIPMPFLMTGTLGAVISMRETPKTAKALVDIGVAGPLAGFLVSLPVLMYGIAHGEVVTPSIGWTVFGESLLHKALVAWLHPPFPAGSDLKMTPVAMAGWTGMLLTMINVIPIGQLDGGHIAYGLLGPRQNRISRLVHRALLVLGIGVSLWAAAGKWTAGADSMTIARALATGLNWIVWWVVLTVMTSMHGGEHPSLEEHDLSPTRRVVAWLTLGLFILLFMPTWMHEI